MFAAEVDEFACLRHDDTPVGCSGDRDASAASELEKSFVSKELEGTQQGVLVHAEDGGKILGRWQAFAGLGFAVCDCSP